MRHSCLSGRWAPGCAYTPPPITPLSVPRPSREANIFVVVIDNDLGIGCNTSYVMAFHQRDSAEICWMTGWTWGHSRAGQRWPTSPSVAAWHDIIPLENVLSRNIISETLEKEL